MFASIKSALGGGDKKKESSTASATPAKTSQEPVVAKNADGLHPLLVTSMAFRKRLTQPLIDDTTTEVQSQRLSHDVWRNKIIPFLHDDACKKFRNVDDDRDPTIVAMARTCRCLRRAIEVSLASRALDRYYTRAACRQFEKIISQEESRARVALVKACSTSGQEASVAGHLKSIKRIDIPLYKKPDYSFDNFDTTLPSFRYFSNAYRPSAEGISIFVKMGLFDTKTEPLVRSLIVNHNLAKPARLELVKILVEQYKCDVNCAGLMDGSTPMHLAVKQLDVDLIKYLIKRGANLLAEMRSASATADEGGTPLDVIVQMSRGNCNANEREAIDVIQKLLEDAIEHAQ